MIPAWLIPYILPYVLPLLSLVLGKVGKLIKLLIDRALPKVKEAAESGKFPSGAEAHEWVKSEILPEIKSTGIELLPMIASAAADVAVKAAYDKLYPNGVPPAAK